MTPQPQGWEEAEKICALTAFVVWVIWVCVTIIDEE